MGKALMKWAIMLLLQKHGMASLLRRPSCSINVPARSAARKIFGAQQKSKLAAGACARIDTIAV